MKLYLGIPGSFYLAEVLAKAEKKTLLDDYGNEVIQISFGGVTLNIEKSRWERDRNNQVVIRVEKTRFSQAVVEINGPPLAIDAVIKLLPRGKVEIVSAPEWERDRN